LLIKLIDKLEKHGKVFITSECKLANEFKKYQIMISPNKMHDVMAFSSLFIGDSQTMCAEAGILGTPFIRFSDFVGKIEYLNDLENNYKLGWGVKTNEPEKIFNIINELFLIQNFKKEWQLRKDKPFNEKIDLTGFSIWFVENYPKSVEVMKKNPEYQLRFK
jgi:predicted glycosyltransferase